MTLWWTEQALSKLPEDKSQFVILLDRDNCENALDTEYLQKVAEIFQVRIKCVLSVKFDLFAFNEWSSSYPLGFTMACKIVVNLTSGSFYLA